MSKSFTLYDMRHYSTVDVVTGYAQWAPTYDDTVDNELDIPLLINLQTVPWLKINKAVDLGCGTGKIGKWLQNKGIYYIRGVDCSSAMVHRAAAKRIYNNLDVADITQTSLPSCSYDIAVTSLAVCHLENLHGLYTEVARILQPGGLFVLVDYHPFFLLRGIPTNFECKSGKSIAIENFVHLFSDHISSGYQVNFRLLEMQERVVDSAWVAHKSGMAQYLNQPISFCMVWES
ncbi:MAG: class I SAM-dependent methyltransferase [Cyanobacteria bacterium J06635_10]